MDYNVEWNTVVKFAASLPRKPSLPILPRLKALKWNSVACLKDVCRRSPPIHSSCCFITPKRVSVVFIETPALGAFCNLLILSKLPIGRKGAIKRKRSVKLLLHIQVLMHLYCARCLIYERRMGMTEGYTKQQYTGTPRSRWFYRMTHFLSN